MGKDIYSVCKDYEALKGLVERLVSDLSDSNHELNGYLNYVARSYNDQLEQLDVKGVEYHSWFTAIYSQTADCVYVYVKLAENGHPVYADHTSLKHVYTIEGKELPIAVEDLTTEQLICYVEENYDTGEWLDA